MNRWHSETVAQLLQELDARPGGLSPHQAEERLRRYGPNELEPPRQEGLLGRILGQLKDPMILVLLGAAGVSLAASGGEDWLEACLRYIRGNYDYLTEFLAKTWSGRVSAVPLEGTYLAWVDFRQLEPDPEKLEQIMTRKAKVALDEGYIFGPEGNGFERINVATPRANVEECMRRVKAALDTL